MKPPRAYDKQFEITDPQTWQTVKKMRAAKNNNLKYIHTEKRGSYYDRDLKKRVDIIEKRVPVLKREPPTERQLQSGEIIQHARAKLNKRDIP